MVTDIGLIFIGGIIIGVLLCIILVIQIYVWKDLTKKYKNLFLDIKDILKEAQE